MDELVLARCCLCNTPVAGTLKRYLRIVQICKEPVLYKFDHLSEGTIRALLADDKQ